MIKMASFIDSTSDFAPIPLSSTPLPEKIVPYQEKLQTLIEISDSTFLELSKQMSNTVEPTTREVHGDGGEGVSTIRWYTPVSQGLDNNSLTKERNSSQHPTACMSQMSTSTIPSSTSHEVSHQTSLSSSCCRYGRMFRPHPSDPTQDQSDQEPANGNTDVMIQNLIQENLMLNSQLVALEKRLYQLNKDHENALTDMRSRHQQKFLEATESIRSKHKHLAKCMVALQQQNQCNMYSMNLQSKELESCRSTIAGLQKTLEDSLVEIQRLQKEKTLLLEEVRMVAHDKEVNQQLSKQIDTCVGELYELFESLSSWKEEISWLSPLGLKNSSETKSTLKNVSLSEETCPQSDLERVQNAREIIRQISHQLMHHYSTKLAETNPCNVQ